MTLRGIVILTVICASGCGSSVAVTGDREPGDGYPMRSASGLNVVARNAVPAPPLLPFNAAFPNSAGLPLVVFISDPATSEAVHSYLVDAEYDASSPYGAFRLREERTPTGMLESDFVQSVSGFCNDDGDGAGSGCTSTLIDIGSGRHGALLYGPNGDTSVTAVETLDGQDYKLIVMGPGGSFTPERAEAVMREVVDQFQP